MGLDNLFLGRAVNNNGASKRCASISSRETAMGVLGAKNDPRNGLIGPRLILTCLCSQEGPHCSRKAQTETFSFSGHKFLCKEQFNCQGLRRLRGVRGCQFGSQDRLSRVGVTWRETRRESVANISGLVIGVAIRLWWLKSCLYQPYST